MSNLGLLGGSPDVWKGLENAAMGTKGRRVGGWQRSLSIYRFRVRHNCADLVCGRVDHRCNFRLARALTTVDHR